MPKDDVIRQMIDYAASMGLVIDHLYTGGDKVARCPVEGKPGKRDGAYRAHLDGTPNITLWNHVTGETGTWCAVAREAMTDDQRAALHARIEQDRQAREADRAHRQALAATKARAIYDAARLDPTGHPYAEKKRLRFPELVRRGQWPQRKWADALLIPIYDEAGQIRTLQAIDVDGTKDLLAGGQKRGCFFPLQKFRGAGRVLIGEGLATVAAGCQAVDCPGVMAIDAGNLLPVGQVVRRLAAPGAEIIFLADDDRSQEDAA
ncbi:MAG: hypothetical protein EOM10_09795 [Opitutae bacterium]|nr:hypothetical protein [Opitutae bacterium]